MHSKGLRKTLECGFLSVMKYLSNCNILGNTLILSKKELKTAGLSDAASGISWPNTIFVNFLISLHLLVKLSMSASRHSICRSCKEVY